MTRIFFQPERVDMGGGPRADLDRPTTPSSRCNETRAAVMVVCVLGFGLELGCSGLSEDSRNRISDAGFVSEMDSGNTELSSRPESGDFVVYARKRSVAATANLGRGEVDIKYAYRLMESNLSSGQVAQIYPTYERWDYQSIDSYQNAVVSGKLLLINYSDPDVFDYNTYTVSQIDPVTLSQVRSMSVRFDEGAPNQVLAVNEEGVYIDVYSSKLGRRLALVRWGATQDDAPHWISLQLPMDVAEEQCRFSLSFEVFDEVLVFMCEVIQQQPTSLCSDACTTADNGVCQDPTNERYSPICELGQDCTDCGVVSYWETCFDSCSTAQNGVCEDWDSNTDVDHCWTGTDCSDCGTRITFEEWKLPREDRTVVVLRSDLDGGNAYEVARVRGLQRRSIVALEEDAVVVAAPAFSNNEGSDNAELGGRSAFDLLRLRGSETSRIYRFAPEGTDPTNLPLVEYYDRFEQYLLFADVRDNLVSVVELTGDGARFVVSGRMPGSSTPPELYVAHPGGG